ncbi:MAG: enolase C-terminal domain-like protein, partial [Planctomycetota bacterium]
MSRPIPIARLTIWQLAIPMKQSFRHATAERSVSEPLIVAVELSDGTVGYGETHPRTYVTGESMEDAIRSVREVFVPLLVEMRPANFGEAIEAAGGLPLVDSTGKVITAARAAVELAVLDAYSRSFERSLETIAGWLGESWLGPPGSVSTARFSGVVSGESPERVARSIRKMRLLRLPHFKLKVGDADDDARIAAAVRVLGRGLQKGKVTLRLDANEAWTLEEASAKLEAWEAYPISSVEQPLGKHAMDDWATLATRTNLPLMADESLVTPEDAETLIARRAASGFNIRISKNGGLIPAIKLAMMARKHHIQCQLGCMVGETSLLSAAGRWFLQLVPGVTFVEGSFGSFLLKDDVVRRGLRFGWAGRWTPMSGHGLGMTVDVARLASLSDHSPVAI